jgi:hypothetical protein
MLRGRWWHMLVVHNSSMHAALAAAGAPPSASMELPVNTARAPSMSCRSTCGPLIYMSQALRHPAGTAWLLQLLLAVQPYDPARPAYQHSRKSRMGWVQ